MGNQMKPVGNFDQGGVVIDSDPFSLQDNEWSLLRNVRTDNRVIQKITGEEQMLTTTTNPIAIDYWRALGAVDARYIYIDVSGNVRTADATQGGTDGNLTGSLGFMTEAQGARYNTTFFNGGATWVGNDSLSTPRYANLGDSSITTLPGWTYDSINFSSVTAKVFRGFRNVLIAGNLRYVAANTNTLGFSNGQVIEAPNTIRVSNLAARGALPTWDPQLTGATTADEFDLATNSPIIDMVPLQGGMAIYTEDSSWLLTLTGNNSLPVAIRPLSTGRGMLSLNCGIEFKGRNFVVGNEDIYLNGGGAAVQTVADGRIKDYFFNNLNYDALHRVHVIHNRRQDEIWVNYPKGTNTTCNEALIWNYTHNTWVIRDLNNINDSTYGAIRDGNDFQENNNYIQMITGNIILTADMTNGFNGQPINSFVERRGFDFMPNNSKFNKWSDKVYYIIKGSGNVTISTRTTDQPGRPVDFSNRADNKLEVRNFSLSNTMGDYKIDPRVNGRFYNTRIESNDSENTWELIRYTLSYDADDSRAT